ncbi:phosphoribosylglycinamide formyltransferase [candidate division KSB1 bacterium]|nr:phosphoribosylglycinamide formyltransferase [candidate division KSB1 bacterium]
MADLVLGVLASGRGSNFDAILNNIKNGTLNARIGVVISNNKSAGALDIARENSIPAIHLASAQFDDKSKFADTMLDTFKKYDVNFVVLAGYMKMIPVKVVQAFKHRMLNIHPALLPSFGGKGFYGHNVHEAVLAYGCKVSGATVHLVDEEYDTGAPVIQRTVPVLDDDTPETLAARVLVVEHQIFSEALQLFATDRIEIHGRHVRIKP